MNIQYKEISNLFDFIEEIEKIPQSRISISDAIRSIKEIPEKFPLESYVVPFWGDEVLLLTKNKGEQGMYPLETDFGIQVTPLSVSHFNFVFVSKQKIGLLYGE
ncbi:MAG: hypothetical protein WCO58_00190 [bacterium]